MKHVEEIFRTMNDELDKILSCLDLLSENQVWYRFKSNMNSVGNLCVHLAGNEYHHFISGIGNKPNIRRRTVEFTSDRTHSKHELKELLTRTRQESISILQKITEGDLNKPIRINYSEEDWISMKDWDLAATNYAGYTTDLQIILFEVCEHYGYHTGQIVILTKLLVDTNKSISGYKH